MPFFIVTSLLFAVFIERNIFSSSSKPFSVTKCTRRLVRRGTYLQTISLVVLLLEAVTSQSVPWLTLDCLQMHFFVVLD